MKKILIIGGGASGMMAALCAAGEHTKVTIYERLEKIGKKILATGNGKCNLTNLSMGTEHFYTDDTDKLARCLNAFSEKDTCAFFERMGLMLRDRDGYVYPYCEQAAVVSDMLRQALEERKVRIFTSVDKLHIRADKNNGFVVESNVGKAKFDAVILACGSKAGIKNAATDGYDYAKAFGHKIQKLYPALVQVRCKEAFWKMVAGVRCKAAVNLYLDGKRILQEQGEVQFTDYGISGIPVFQISREIAGFLDEKKNIKVGIDFIPHLTEKQWREFCDKRIKIYAGKTAEEFMLGLLHKKLSAMLLKEYGLKPSDVLGRIDQSGRGILEEKEVSKKLLRMCEDMKKFMVTPGSVNPFEQAQVCRGGVRFSELDDTMQSVFQKNLYICGEMVDIDGKCGGYNLQWAWTSGYLAGTGASKQ